MPDRTRVCSLSDVAQRDYEARIERIRRDTIDHYLNMLEGAVYFTLDSGREKVYHQPKSSGLVRWPLFNNR